MKLYELANTDPAAWAIEDAAERITWAELEKRTAQLANGLHAEAVKPGDHVIIQAGNRLDFLIAVIGAWRAGCPYTPVKTGWTPHEVQVVVDEADTRAFITDKDASRGLAQLLDLTLIDLDDDFATWLARQSDLPTPDEQCGWKLPFTSGTTGRPKGVIMSTSGKATFSQSWKGLADYAELLQLPGDGVHLFATRLFNGAPLTFGLGALARGASLRILAHWDPEHGLAELCRGDVTSTIMVPTMFRQLLGIHSKSAVPSSRLKTILHGGEPCPIPVKQAMLDWFGPVLLEYYGFTEGGMAIVDSANWTRRPGTVGKAWAGLHAEIRDADGNVLPARKEGTIYFSQTSGERRFGYLKDDSKTESAHIFEHFTVGDIGWMDEDGYIYISGRSADLVIIAGMNVYPAETEQALADIPGVADLCAVGAPDPVRGERMVLLVVTSPEAEQAAVRASLESAADARLAAYKRPTEIRFVDEIPRDETGKLLRAKVRDQLKEEGKAHVAQR